MQKTPQTIQKNVMNMNFNSYVDNNKVSAQSIVGEIEGFMPLMGATSSQMTFTGYTVWELPVGWNQMQFSYIDALSGEDSEKHLLQFGAISAPQFLHLRILFIVNPTRMCSL